MHAAMRCPVDGDVLRRVILAKGGAGWICPACSARAITMPALRRNVAAPFAQQLTAAFANAQVPSFASCPSCSRQLQVVEVEAAGQPVELDVCKTCALVWFDAGEYEQAPAAPASRKKPDLFEGMTEQQREQMGEAMVRDMQRASRRAEMEERPRGLAILPAVLGMPIELDGKVLAGKPVLTWLVAALIAATSVHGWFDERFLRAVAFVPADWGERPLTVLTSALVHGDWVHLVGNLWFLIVFGDNVELAYGRARWLVLLVAGSLAGGMLHWLGGPGDTTPCIGASDGISALIVCYGLSMPNDRIGMFVLTRYSLAPMRGNWVTFSARTGILLWFGMQLLLVFEQLAGYGNVSALAHIGGAAVGVAGWWAWRDREPGGASS